jgi:hypothetical protein
MQNVKGGRSALRHRPCRVDGPTGLGRSACQPLVTLSHEVMGEVPGHPASWLWLTGKLHN